MKNLFSLHNMDAVEFLRNLESGSVDLCVTDPPYRTISGGKNDFKDKKRPGGILLKNDGKIFEHNDIDHKEWIKEVYRVLKANSDFYCMTNLLNLFTLKDIAESVGFKLHNLLVWKKNNCLGGNTQILIRNLETGLCYRSNFKDLYRNFNEKNREAWEIMGENGEFKKISSVHFLGKQEGVTITFRNGVSLFCTPDHKFLTVDGLKKVKNMKIGDVVARCTGFNIPSYNRVLFDYDLGKFVGLFVAEGSYSKKNPYAFEFTLNRDADRTSGDLVRKICEKWGANYNKFSHKKTYCDSHKIASPILSGVLRNFISGDSAKTKHFKREVFNENITFLRGLIDGYLEGDGHKEQTGENSYRYIIGFTYNKELEHDLRLACDVLGYKMTAKTSKTNGFGKKWTCITGRLIKEYKSVPNTKNLGEIINISKPHKQNVYDITVEGNHLYSLVGGFVTHNCTPNKWYMKNAEFTLYFYKGRARPINELGSSMIHEFKNIVGNKLHPTEKPVELMEFYIKNSSSFGELVLDPFMGSGTTGIAALNLHRNFLGCEIDSKYYNIAKERIENDKNKY